MGFHRTTSPLITFADITVGVRVYELGRQHLAQLDGRIPLARGHHTSVLPLVARPRPKAGGHSSSRRGKVASTGVVGLLTSCPPNQHDWIGGQYQGVPPIDH